MKSSIKASIKNIKSIVETSANSAEFALVEKRINVSSEKQESAIKNIAARFRTVETFKNASEKALLLIAKNSDDVAISELMNYSNYKTANRVLQLAEFMSDNAIDSRTQQNINILQTALKTLSKSFDAIDYSTIEARTNITSSMLKNMLKACQLLKIVKRADNASIKATIKSDTRYTLLIAE